MYGYFLPASHNYGLLVTVQRALKGWFQELSGHRFHGISPRLHLQHGGGVTVITFIECFPARIAYVQVEIIGVWDLANPFCNRLHAPEELSRLLCPKDSFKIVTSR